MPQIKVLLVDDEVLIKDVLREKIDWARFDMEVVAAVGSADCALTYVRHAPVDLMITDIRMPCTDGNDLIRQISRLGLDIRFLALSAYTDFETVRKSFTLGVFDYLQKTDIGTPAMDQILLRLRNEIISKKKTTATRITAPALNDRIKADTCCTAICIRTTVDLSSDDLAAIGQTEHDEPQLCLGQAGAGFVKAYLIHRSHTVSDSQRETEDWINRRRQLLAGTGDRCIGISSTGYGASADKLAAEAERAAGHGYYLPSGLHVVYSHAITDDRAEEKMDADVWRSAIYGQLRHFNIDQALDVVKTMLQTLAEIRPEPNACCDLVESIYCYCLHFFKDQQLLEPDSDFEMNEHEIALLIRQMERYDKLKNWVEWHLDQLKQQFYLQYTGSITRMIQRYIEMNLSETLSLDDIARAFNLNRSYVSYLFKQEAGLPLKRYINNMRLEQASACLMNTGMKIKDICAFVGYNNIEHFSRAFKVAFGLSPLSYREQKQKNCCQDL